MRRRDLLFLVTAAATWPLAAHAQQREKVPRIGIIAPYAADEPENQLRLAAFQQELGRLGWTIGRNVRVDYRWAVDPRRVSALVADLLALAPDVVFASGPPIVQTLQQHTRTVPIVFAAVTDPVALGLVQSLSRPGSNATGFAAAEFGMSAKWLQVLKEIAPVKRVAVIQDPGNLGSAPQFSAIQSVAPTFDVDLSTIFVRDPDEFAKAVEAFAREPNGGLVVTRTTGAISHRDLIVKLAAQHRLPAIYPLRLFVTSGGLLSYGPDVVDHFRLAAGYVDRILKGEKPAELPVQTPNKYELVINLKTAKVLDLTVPPPLLARADEVIE